MDDLRQLFEIKMASGRIPNDLTLKQAEAIAAQDPDFFLAVVEGLEDSDVPLSVRFIFDPLRTLAQRITGNVTLSSIRDVEALQYVFAKPVDGSPRSEALVGSSEGSPSGEVQGRLDLV